MKKLVAVVSILLLIFIIRGIIVSLQNFSQNNKVIADLKESLAKEKKEREFLTQQLEYVKSDEFVEREAREKLGLVKKGEYIVIAPPPTLQEEPKKRQEFPNWKKWLDLFF